MNHLCKHLIFTPYGQACDLFKTFVRTGDMVLCGGCTNDEPFEDETKETPCDKSLPSSQP